MKNTCEYAEASDLQILQAAGKTKSNMNSTGKSEKGGKKVKKDNDWIPTEAVRAIQKIREEFKGIMSETCIS